jgi:hypothetical protein
MLFFMGSSTHMPNGLVTDASTVGLAAIMLVIAALEINGIAGKQGPMTSVRGVIHSGIGLTVVLYGMMVVL